MLEHEQARTRTQIRRSARALDHLHDRVCDHSRREAFDVVIEAASGLVGKCDAMAESTAPGAMHTTEMPVPALASCHADDSAET